MTFPWSSMARVPTGCCGCPRAGTARVPTLSPPPQLAELQDKATSAETKVLEMGTTVEGLQWDSAKLRKREGRLDRHLAEALEQVTPASPTVATASPTVATTSLMSLNLLPALPQGHHPWALGLGGSPGHLGDAWVSLDVPPCHLGVT